jgi:CheY-like chemotaxis protein
LRPASGTRQRVGRVLIVDDELLIAQSLRRILADEFEVSATAAPSMALAWLASGKCYDVILCDVMMPDMNGLELRARVEHVAPEQATRFVFMTGGILLPEVQALLDATPSIVLAKPFDYGALRELIRRWVAGEPHRSARLR